MKTDGERLQLIPTSPDTSWLFWMTLSFGIFLAIFAPYRFCSGAVQLIDRDGLTLTSLGLYFMAALSGLMGLRWCVLFILSYAKMSRHDREPVLPRDASLPYVSILAPAYCEAACVKDAMSALVRLDYPAYEVIFVDDGSKDDTYRLAQFLRGNALFGAWCVSCASVHQAQSG